MNSERTHSFGEADEELDEKYDPPEAAPPSPEDSTEDYATLEAWIALREKFQVFKKTADDND